MKTWKQQFDENSLMIVIGLVGACFSLLFVGISSFLCLQVYAMRSEITGMQHDIASIDKRLGKIEDNSMTAYQGFNDKHSALSNKMTELEVKFSAFAEKK